MNEYRIRSICTESVDLRPGLLRSDPLGSPRRKEKVAVIYGEPETPRFLAALQRLKRQQRLKERQTRAAKQRVRHVLRKIREC
jgi:hypothetical protein